MPGFKDVVCCDPLKVHKKKSKKGLRNVSIDMVTKFPSLLNKESKLCNSCRKKINNLGDEAALQPVIIDPVPVVISPVIERGS